MSKSIVIIDDDPDDLSIIREMAGLIGFTYPLIAFSEPVPAIKHILSENENVALIIADVNMPKLNGFEVREKMIESGVPYIGIPFVFLSTSKSDGEIQKAKELDVHEYYKKPATFADFKDILLLIKNNNGL